MSKMISLTDSCYAALESLKKKIKEEKKSRGEPTKTTFSELTCMLLKEHEAATTC